MPLVSSTISSTPPRAPPIKYAAPLGTRWDKEKAAAGGAHAFDLPTDPKFIGPWIIGECVGKGASGRVKIAKHRLTGQLAAVKILPLAPLVDSRVNLTAEQQLKSEKQRLGIDREITMMKLMNHPNILRIYDVYEGAKELFLVLEYVEGGELFDFLVNRGRLPPADARTFFKQIILGLNYAHTFSIIHRDLKPENILIASLDPPLLKIADWGMAAFAPPTLQLETSCGSPHYASPEIVNGERYQGNATDIWSCGVILFALLTGRLPFDDKNVKALLGKVKLGKYELPLWVDSMARDLLQKMLVVDSAKRITIPEILAHPWLTTTLPISRTMSAPSPDPMLPPSPSTLARPIPSPSMVDPALFSSLRVIWGRHADKGGEIIRKDLLSPEGEGVHAKAFYFLLGKFREEREKERSPREKAAEKSNLCGTSGAAKALEESLTFNLGWELPVETVGVSKIVNPTSRPDMASRKSASSSTSSPINPDSKPTTAGFTQPVSAPARKTSFGVSGNTVPMPAMPRRGYTYSGASKVTSRESDEAAVISSVDDCATHGRLQLHRAKTHRPRNRTDETIVIQRAGKQSKAPSSEHGIATECKTNSPSPTSDEPPRMPSLPLTELKPRVIRDRAVSMAAAKPLSRRTENPNEIDAGIQATVAVESLITKAERRPRERATSLATASLIKNKASDGPSCLPPLDPLQDTQRATARARAPSLACHVEKENEGGRGINDGKDAKSLAGDLSKKGLGLAKKGKLRPPPLEFPFPPLTRKRSSADVVPPDQPVPLGLRNQEHTATQPANQTFLHQTSYTSASKSPLISPKFPPLSFSSASGPGSPKTPGWLSGLFSGWKSSSMEDDLRLYSQEDVPRTKADVIASLEAAGVSVQLAEGHGEEVVVLKCGYRDKAGGEESVAGEEGMGNMKPVRFRVEICTMSSTMAASMSPPMSPILSPPLSYASPRMSCDAPSSSNASSPVTNAYFPPGAGSRLRSTTSPLPSPFPTSRYPWGVSGGLDGSITTAVVVKHEKGSSVTLKAVWKKLRETYPSTSSGIPVSGTGWTPSPGWVVVDEGKVGIAV
ncbi:serine/threonine-protein kinase gin4 [Marasmius crinis-equi]|uniref:Serine/threonine-protein kinase gin4 n=1 Tax=Marasmius crinis-equi TaxID=585013 RepID=A0ABR3FLX1_9AGAR